MLRWLASHPELRRTLSIAAGIFSGLLLYRLGIRAWYALDYSGHLGDAFILAAFAAAVALAVFLYRRFRPRLRGNVAPVLFAALIVAMCIAAVVDHPTTAPARLPTHSGSAPSRH